MRRAHDPSRFRRRGLWLRRHPQQQAGHAGGLRPQRQLAAGDEVELARFAPDLQHHGAERIAGQRVRGGPQRGLHVGGSYGHEAARIETELGQSAHRQRARFNFGKILPNPQQRSPCGHPPCEPRDKPRRRGALPATFREHLMHRPEGEAALQHRIGLGMPEHDPARRMDIALRLDALDAAAQNRKRVRASAAHAPSLEDGGRHWLFG